MATTVTLKPNAIDLSGSTSGTTTLQASAVAGTTTLTLPAATDTLVGKATTDTLTNKTLTTPIISSLTSAAATALTLQSAGTTAVTVDTSQNVGIGTTSPAYKLDVVGTINVPSDSSYTLGAGADRYIKYRSGNGDILYSFSAGNFYQQHITSSYHAWFTSNNERMRIDSSGNVLVGTTTNSSSTPVAYFNATGASSDAVWAVNTNPASTTLLVWNKSTTGNNNFQNFCTEGTVTSRGTITYNRAGGLVAYNTTSDYRAKIVNGPVENALAKVALLKPSTGRMNGASIDIEFFVAHELQEIVPSAVTGEKDAVKEDGSPAYQMVDKSAIIPLLAAAIQEQQALITSLTARVVALESK
jgi:hypothetical protein